MELFLHDRSRFLHMENLNKYSAAGLIQTTTSPNYFVLMKLLTGLSSHIHLLDTRPIFIKLYYEQISWSLETARLDFEIFELFCNFAAERRPLSNYRWTDQFEINILRLWGIAIFQTCFTYND